MDGYREDGKKKYVYFTAPTKSEARQLLAAYQSRKNAPEEETTGCEPPQAVLLGDVADTWYEDYSTQVRASTYNTYSYTLKILKRYLGDKPIDGILPMDVNHFLDELSAVPYSRSCMQRQQRKPAPLYAIPFSSFSSGWKISPCRGLRSGRSISS